MDQYSTTLWRHECGRLTVVILALLQQSATVLRQFSLLFFEKLIKKDGELWTENAIAITLTRMRVSYSRMVLDVET
jgi:hypothetical protein